MEYHSNAVWEKANKLEQSLIGAERETEEETISQDPFYYPQTGKWYQFIDTVRNGRLCVRVCNELNTSHLLRCRSCGVEQLFEANEKIDWHYIEEDREWLCWQCYQDWRKR